MTNGERQEQDSLGLRRGASRHMMAEMEGCTEAARWLSFATGSTGAVFHQIFYNDRGERWVFARSLDAGSEVLVGDATEWLPFKVSAPALAALHIVQPNIEKPAAYVVIPDAEPGWTQRDAIIVSRAEHLWLMAVQLAGTWWASKG